MAVTVTVPVAAAGAQPDRPIRGRPFGLGGPGPGQGGGGAAAGLGPAEAEWVHEDAVPRTVIAGAGRWAMGAGPGPLGPATRTGSGRSNSLPASGGEGGIVRGSVKMPAGAGST